MHTARPSQAGLPGGPPAAPDRPLRGARPLLDAEPAFARPQVRASGRLRATWAILLADLVALELSLFLGYSLRIFLLPWFPQEFQPQHYKGLALGVLVIPLVYFLLDLYPGYGMNPAERLRKRVQATFVVFSLLLAWDYLVQGHQWSRGIVLCTGLFAFILPALFDEIARHFLSNAGIMGIPVLVLGGGKTGRHIIRHLLENPGLGLRPAAILDDDGDLEETRIFGVPVVGTLDEAARFGGTIETAIVALPGMEEGRQSRLIQKLPFSHVIVVPNLQGIQSLWVTPRDLGGILGLEVNRNLLMRSSHTMKRCMDLAIAWPLLLLAVPVLAVCALLLKLLSPGPVFFRQSRAGKNGHLFEMLKLRTMHPNAEQLLREHLARNPEERTSWARYFKLKSDPRIIPFVGAALRRFSLDELPQLWHVITGDMSLVGPRPFPAYHLEAFHTEFRGLRASVTPGLTGLWQVSARSDGDIDVQEILDSYYIRNWSPWLDLHILIRTFRVVVLGRGAY
ncbi:MAG: exopolysaccharide biosynthesis polyprenyl glycosylphosphotransferase [Acidobacteria bacterium]|nr:exopolysaccharide biosynthesis polyprenyl glycosylphosphotransferase [Acidobacteriota bacterium]